MSAISLSSFSFRPTQGATLPSTQQTQRGTAFGSPGGVNAARGGNTGSAYCPTCVGGVSGSGNTARAGSSASSSFCPTCNTAGGRQTSATHSPSTNSFGSTSFRSGVAQTGAAGGAHNHQGGRICVGCAYQGR